MGRGGEGGGEGEGEGERGRDGEGERKCMYICSHIVLKDGKDNVPSNSVTILHLGNYHGNSQFTTAICYVNTTISFELLVVTQLPL